MLGVGRSGLAVGRRLGATDGHPHRVEAPYRPPAASKQGAVTGQASAEQQVLVISRVTT